MGVSFQELEYIPIELLVKYLQVLKRRPVLTKSVTSAIIAGLGDTIYQVSKRDDKNRAISWRSVAAVAGSGLVVTGPLSHYFYLILDQVSPPGTKLQSFKRLFIDRVLFGPIYLLIVLYVRHIFEGTSHREAKRKLLRTFWPILKMSYRVWTIAQYININHIPQQYRVLFSNVVALGWNVYLAAMKRDAKR